MQVKCKRMHPDAILPRRATEGSCGYDLYARLDGPVTISHGQIVRVATGIAVEQPDAGMAAFVFGRSGLGAKNGVVPANAVGVVDSDYRGEIFVPLLNQTDIPYTVRPGERIAQMIFLPVLLPELVETGELSDSERGEAGFGSTGR